MMNKLMYLVVAFMALSFLVIASIFKVDQRQNAIVFQFGESVKVVEKPGLSFKVPFIQNVEFFDNRILNVVVEAKELTASDEKRIIVDAYAKYKITHPLMFFKTVRNVQNIQLRLNKIVESAMRKVIGQVPLITLLSERRGELMEQIRDIVDGEASSFGVDIIDVRILKADLPAENSAAIYRRMITERQKDASQIRAEGYEESDKIRARADKERQIILANAYAEAESIKGEGDAKASEIYNKSYSQDEAFYEFYRSLVLYQSTMNKDDTSFILSPKSALFKYLNLNE